MIIEIKIEGLFRIAFLETTLVKKTFVFNSNVSGTWLYQLDFDLNGSKTNRQILSQIYLQIRQRDMNTKQNIKLNCYLKEQHTKEIKTNQLYRGYKTKELPRINATDTRYPISSEQNISNCFDNFQMYCFQK